MLRLINWLKALNVARKLTLIFWLESDAANWHMMDSAMNVQKESKFLLYLAARGKNLALKLTNYSLLYYSQIY